MFRSSSFKEDEGTWKGNDDGKVVNNQPQRVMDDRNGLGPQGGYIARLVMWYYLFTQTLLPKI
jgi:synaptosomal-associated protein 25